jgi:signal transduction histidine kinase
MKLLTKTGRMFLLISFGVYLAGATGGYLVLNYLTETEAIDNLKLSKQKLLKELTDKPFENTNWISLSDSIQIIATDKLTTETITDIELYNSLEKEVLAYKKLTFTENLNGKLYQISVFKPLYELEDFQEVLLITFGIIMFMLLVLLFWINYWYSKKLWSPFYGTLESLADFKTSSNTSLDLPQTNIHEFESLNTHINTLTKKVQNDFQNLKTFTENASHEMQTPLAVINSNLEMLIQDENLNQNQVQQIGHLLESIGKLSKLNQTLLLISKIENRQFEKNEKIDLTQTLANKLTLLQPWIEGKNIQTEYRIDDSVAIEMNAYLLEVLLNNVLGNAIKYNLENGSLKVTLTHKYLKIENLGNKLNKPTEQLFQRFQKDNTNKESIGLGLAIVKQICETYGFTLTYENLENTHLLTISFQ